MNTSPSLSTIPLIDSNGNAWTVSAGEVFVNNVHAGLSSNTSLLLFYQNVIYTENNSGYWWKWVANTWVQTTDPRVISNVTSNTINVVSNTANVNVSNTIHYIPPAAAEVGYNVQTFGPNLAINVNWFPWNFYGSGNQPAGFAANNANGTIFISGLENNQSGASISSAKQTSNGNNWIGKAFGGGAYFEANLSFTGQSNGPYENGGPAFWSLDIEHSSQGPYAVNWPGTQSPWTNKSSYSKGEIVSYENQYWISAVNNNTSTPPSRGQQSNGNWLTYNDFFEVDFMEYDANEFEYQCGIGNWYEQGLSTSNPNVLGGSAGAVKVPANTNFAKPHLYGCLWVPATGNGQNTITKGYLKFFFDNVQVGNTFFWDYHDPNEANTYPLYPPVDGSTAMSGMDHRHMYTMLGTGNNMPMIVYSSNVYQTSDKNNLYQ